MKSSLLAELRDAVSVIKLDKAKMLEVSLREKATVYGFAFLFVPSVLNLVLGALSFPSGFGAIFTSFLFWPMMIPPIALASVIFLMSLIAEKLFNGAGKPWPFFRTVSYTALILFISVIPFVLSVFGLLHPFGLYNFIWLAQLVSMFLVSYHFLKIHHKLQEKDVVVVLVVGVIGFFLIRGLLGSLLMGSGAYGFFY